MGLPQSLLPFHFNRERTRRWFSEQFALSARSLARFSLPAAEVRTCERQWVDRVDSVVDGLARRFPAVQARSGTAEDLTKVATLVLSRGSLGAPSVNGLAARFPEREAECRRVLFGYKLDLLVHRICYWADG